MQNRSSLRKERQKKKLWLIAKAIITILNVLASIATVCEWLGIRHS